MSICESCKGEMLEVSGCVKTPIPIWTGKMQLRLTNGGRSAVRMETTTKVLEPIPFGKEQRYGKKDGTEWRIPPPKTDERCHDCGALPGHYHHPGCDWEECPGCHTQMLMCGGECGEKA